jgi:hypothetical protein
LSPPDVISRYFDTDARRDIDAVVALFTEDATLAGDRIRHLRIAP